MVNRAAMGQVFSDYFGFPYQLAFHRLLHSHHYLSSWAGTVGQTVAGVPTGSISPNEVEREKVSATATLVKHFKTLHVGGIMYRIYTEMDLLSL
jgi:hypothetical protein